MGRTLSAFRALYAATLLMLIGSGLLSTYMALRLASEEVPGAWIGALTGAQYLGLVLGGKVGHRLIARVGHIRAYVACAGIVTAAVLNRNIDLSARVAAAAYAGRDGHDVPVHGVGKLVE